MVPITPKSIHLLVGMNSTSTDVGTLKSLEKKLLEDITKMGTSSPKIEVAMFDLLDRGEEIEGGPADGTSQRNQFLNLMNDPKVDVVDIEYSMRQAGEGENIRWHYTAVVTYQRLPFYGPCANYEMWSFTLPFNGEQMGAFLTMVSGETLVTKEEKPYIKKTSIVRQDKLFEVTGAITYYYHTVSSFSPVRDVNESTGIPAIPPQAG